MNYGNLLQCYGPYEKTIVARQEQPLGDVSRRQQIMNCKNVANDIN